MINDYCCRIQSRLNPVPESLNSPDIVPGKIPREKAILKITKKLFS